MADASVGAATDGSSVVDVLQHFLLQDPASPSSNSEHTIAESGQRAAGQQGVNDVGEQGGVKSPPAAPAAQVLSAPSEAAEAGATSAGAHLERHRRHQPISFNFLEKDPGLDEEDKKLMQEAANSSVRCLRKALTKVSRGSKQSDWAVTMLVHRPGDPVSYRHPAIISTGWVDHDSVMGDVGDKALLSSWQQRRHSGVTAELEFGQERIVAIAEALRKKPQRLFSAVECFLRKAAKLGQQREARRASSTGEQSGDGVQDPLQQQALLYRQNQREAWCEFPSAVSQQCLSLFWAFVVFMIGHAGANSD